MMEKNINLNKCSVEDLRRIEGVGKQLAQDLVDYRNQHGPFRTWTDIQKIPGFSPKLIDVLKKNGAFCE
jgi:competence protein ComEA